MYQGETLQRDDCTKRHKHTGRTTYDDGCGYVLEIIISTAKYLKMREKLTIHEFVDMHKAMEEILPGVEKNDGHGKLDPWN